MSEIIEKTVLTSARANKAKMTKGKVVYSGGGGVKLLIEDGKAMPILAIMHRSKKGEIYLRTEDKETIKFPWEPENADSLYNSLQNEYPLNADGSDPLTDNNQLVVTAITRKLTDNKAAIEEFLADTTNDLSKDFVQQAYKAQQEGKIMIDFFITDISLD